MDAKYFHKPLQVRKYTYYNNERNITGFSILPNHVQDFPTRKRAAEQT